MEFYAGKVGTQGPLSIELSIELRINLQGGAVLGSRQTCGFFERRTGYEPRGCASLRGLASSALRSMHPREHLQKVGSMLPKTPILIAVFYLVLVVPSVLHALLFKRHSRAALGWISFIVFAPYVGAVFYVLFGVNRVRTRSRKLTQAARGSLQELETIHREEDFVVWESLEHAREHFSSTEIGILRAGSALTHVPLSPNNRVVPLHNGEEAFPRMLNAIRHAQSHVWLTTYIFETNAKGMEFIEALTDAHQRGVDVRVILDGVGELYFWPLAGPKLRKAGVPLARFLPPKLLPPQIFVNLRNHRKLLVVDGVVAFTGGMNIGGRHMALDPANPHPVQDLHFSLEGPVVHDFENLFLQDWVFSHRHDGNRAPNLPGGRIRDALQIASKTRRGQRALAAARTGEAIDIARGGDLARLEAVEMAMVSDRGAGIARVDEEPTSVADVVKVRSTGAPNPATLRAGERASRAQAADKNMAKDVSSSVSTPRRVVEAEAHSSDANQELERREGNAALPTQILSWQGQEDFDAWCRVIVDGPDHDLSKLETLISSVISSAQSRVVMFSPYFLPTESIESALVNAALRGVEVSVVIPEKTNQPLVHAAMYRGISWMLRRGVKVLLQPPPFAHTKLLIIDDRYVQMGSSNMDPRSLRLNFELAVEVMDVGLVDELIAYYEPVLARSKRLTIDMVRARPLHRRLVDGFAWLFSPYL